MSDAVATQTRQAVAVDEVLDFLDYEVGNDDHIFYDTYSELHDMVSKLGYENAKLRKLAMDMHTLATDPGVYVRYPYCDAWDEKLAVVEEQMRELGVDV